METVMYKNVTQESLPPYHTLNKHLTVKINPRVPQHRDPHHDIQSVPGFIPLAMSTTTSPHKTMPFTPIMGNEMVLSFL